MTKRPEWQNSDRAPGQNSPLNITRARILRNVSPLSSSNRTIFKRPEEPCLNSSVFHIRGLKDNRNVLQSFALNRGFKRCVTTQHWFRIVLFGCSVLFARLFSSRGLQRSAWQLSHFLRATTTFFDRIPELNRRKSIGTKAAREACACNLSAINFQDQALPTEAYGSCPMCLRLYHSNTRDAPKP